MSKRPKVPAKPIKVGRPPRRPAATRAKLKAIRQAARFSFPTADIQRMLGEIERGYEA